MRAIHGVVVVVVLVVTARSRSAAAQGVTVSVGGGAALPLGTLNTVTDAGAHGLAAVSIAPANLPVSIRIDGMYNHFGLSSSVGIDGHFRVFHGTANAVYRFPAGETSTIRPYLIGGLGVYNYKFIADVPEHLQDEDHTDLGLNGGAGADFVVGALGVFAETRYHGVFSKGNNVELLPITVGIRFGGC
jgi:hypothetical protein